MTLAPPPSSSAPPPGHEPARPLSARERRLFAELSAQLQADGSRVSTRFDETGSDSSVAETASTETTRASKLRQRRTGEPRNRRRRTVRRLVQLAIVVVAALLLPTSWTAALITLALTLGLPALVLWLGRPGGPWDRPRDRPSGPSPRR